MNFFRDSRAVIVTATLVAAAVILSIIGGAIVGWVLKPDSSKKIQELESNLTKNKMKSDIDIYIDAEEVGYQSMNFVAIKEDFLQYTKNFAWSLAKYEIVKAISEGENLTIAEQRADEAIKQYYGNITQSVIGYERFTLEVLKHLRDRSLDEDVDYDGIQNVQFVTSKFTTDDKARNYRFENVSISVADQQLNRSILYVGWDSQEKSVSLSADSSSGTVSVTINGIGVATFSSPDPETQNFSVDLGSYVTEVTVTAGGASQTVNFTEPVRYLVGKVDKSAEECNDVAKACISNVVVTFYGMDYVIKAITVDSPALNYTGKTIWEKSEYDKLYADIDNTYKMMKANLHAYVVNISADYVRGNINLSDIIDPYVIAGQMVRDAKNTQYYAYSAAELALLGIPTNITKTWTVRLDDNTTLEGILLADYVGKIKVGARYRFPFAYMVTDKGLYSLCNVNFTVIGIKDYSGKDLNETELVNYNMQSNNVTKLKQELEQLKKLWVDYNKIQPVSGGGWSGSFSDWWAGLDTYAKAGVIILGAIVVYVIFRRA